MDILASSYLFIINLLLIWGLNFAAFGVLAPITGRFGLWLELRNKGWLAKPLYICRPCMSSVWGWIFFFSSYEWYYYPLWVICLAGASVLLKSEPLPDRSIQDLEKELHLRNAIRKELEKQHEIPVKFVYDKNQQK